MNENKFERLKIGGASFVPHDKHPKTTASLTHACTQKSLEPPTWKANVAELLVAELMHLA